MWLPYCLVTVQLAWVGGCGVAGLVPECSGSLGHGSWLDLLPFSSFQWMHIVHTNPYADKYGETTHSLIHFPLPITNI